MQEDFIKKGVIAEEQNGAVVKTASDELVGPQDAFGCCRRHSPCRCRQAKDAVKENLGGSNATQRE